MKYATVLAAIALLPAAFAAVMDSPAPIPPSVLSERACTPSSCRCNGVRGQFCGNEKINPNCKNGHVYECNPNHNTCDYGIRNSCVQCGKLKC